VQDVGQQQFLVLLLVVAAQLDERQCFGGGVGQQVGQRGVHMGAVGLDLGEAGAAQQPALRAGVAGAQAFVIGVEEPRPALVEDFVVGQVRHQPHGFEEPGRVRHVPLRRAGVGHGLELGVFVRKGGGQGQRMGACGAQQIGQRGGHEVQP